MIAGFTAKLRVPLLVIASLATASCSLPSLETPACTESKNAIRDFYSFHFGRDMLFTQDGLDARTKFLTPDYRSRLQGSAENVDPFTTGDSDLPKAFRVGECREVTTEHTESQVLIFWRDDERTEQRTIKVETIDVNDAWLINNISR